MSLSGFSPQLRVVLGPTNTGKTHLAMERLLAHQSGMIGLPLRLLARETYDRCLRGDFGRVHKADIALNDRRRENRAAESALFHLHHRGHAGEPRG